MRRHARLSAQAGMVAGLLLGFAASGNAQFLVIGDDNKLDWDDAGKPVFSEPGKDEVVIVDIKNRESPTIAASLPLTNTVIGPPTNLAITPDESLALVANSLNYEPNGSGGWKPVPDNKIYVIDLKATPPAALSRRSRSASSPRAWRSTRPATLALVADRADNAVTVLTINGKEVKPVQTDCARRHGLGGRHHAGRQARPGHQARGEQGGVARYRRAERELRQEGHRGRQSGPTTSRSPPTGISP